MDNKGHLSRFALVELALCLFGVLLISCVANDEAGTEAWAPATELGRKDSGYRGIWYESPTSDGSAYKYSGGLGTYPANIGPFAAYSPVCDKTFFCYGGSGTNAITGGPSLWIEVGSYDHRTGLLSSPYAILDKGTQDAHDNPAIELDSKGYIWVFACAHTQERPAFIYRSSIPYSIDSFDRVYATRLSQGQQVPMQYFSYAQVHYDGNTGFFTFFTRYEPKQTPHGIKTCRIAAYMQSADGVHWSEWKDLANIEEGSYQVSERASPGRYGTALSYNPYTASVDGLDYRTNLYYMETGDCGRNWKSAAGIGLSIPLVGTHSPALVRDYGRERLLVYIDDLAYDSQGNPLILYLTSKSAQPGGAGAPHTWRIAAWDGTIWKLSTVSVSDHDYDMGSLYVEDDGSWRVIGPAGGGPQAWACGGDILSLVSRDHGATWERETLFKESLNAGYVRRPQGGNPGFYAFWADGNPQLPSDSSLYFSTKSGKVFRLPRETKGEPCLPEALN
jgi:hypothetical protein